MITTLEFAGMRIDALDGGSLSFSFERPGKKVKLELAVRPLLVRTPSWSCLIDPGFGPADPVRRERFRLRDPVPLERQCAELGLPDGPDHVVLTHLHFDHAAGALVAAGEVERARFPEARHYVHPTEWQAATSDERGGRLAARLEQALGAPPRALPDRGAVFPGLEVELAPGHTEGLVAIWLLADGGSALFAADLIPTRRFLVPRLDRMADQEPEVALATRARLLARAHQLDTHVCFYHDVAVPWGQLEKSPDGEGFALRHT